MGRTSIKNKLILSFLGLLIVVMVVVGVVIRLTNDYYLGLIISTAFAMATGIIFGNIFSRSLVRRLNSLCDVAQEVSKGDLTREIPIVSRDEVRDLEELFAKMVTDLKAVISEMNHVASQIQNTNSNLGEQVEKVMTNSKEIDRSSQAIAKGSEDQTLIVQKVSLVLDSGLKEMDELARQGADTVSKIDEAGRKIEAGETNAKETLKHLEEVLKKMSENTKPIFKLANKVEKIKLVINVMDDISQKIDLLSLNASIEATRSGESGKGFALVANEIRSMAESSKQSAREIGKIVVDILEDNNAVREFLAESQAGINKGQEIITGVVGTFSEMLSGVKEIDTQVREMEQITRNQVKQIRGMLNHFQDLSRLANENFVFTQKSTVATQNQEKDVETIVQAMSALNALSEKMVGAHQHFKLERGGE